MILLLLACAPSNSCAAYVNVASRCIERAGGDASAYTEDSFCGDWSDEDQARDGDWYDCRAAAWRASACKDTEDVTEAISSEAECDAG
jgi:hypothetical protein